MMKKYLILFVFSILINVFTVISQNSKAVLNDSHTPLHLLKPDYEIPYAKLTVDQIKNKIDKVLTYLDLSTYSKVEDAKNQTIINDYKNINSSSQLKRGDFRIASYEWGVTYAAMLTAGTNTKDERYFNYVKNRLDFLAEVAPYFKKVINEGKPVDSQMNQILNPHALDDAGAVCASMINAGLKFSSIEKYKPLIENYMDFILNKEKRLSDGTFSRNRPFKNSVWLDDMYMSLPAIANYGKMTGDDKYTDMAVNQIFLFAEKMFVKETGLFRHGWIESMEEHPSFHWGRANGWAILTICDVLDVIPENHPKRNELIGLLKLHVKGLSRTQSGSGFWHQLLDKNDSYNETSCTAIFTYCIAHAINEGWIDGMSYGPVAQLGWNAVSTKITESGRVEGTCVGTGMGFDPAFYYHRPVSSSAAHGYGPVLLAGAEMIRLINTKFPEMNDSAIQYYNKKQKSDKPIFAEE
jgi:rhamnogalacturonyl hydrolase YesR